MTVATLVSFRVLEGEENMVVQWSAERRGNDGSWGRQGARWAGAMVFGKSSGHHNILLDSV